MPPMKLAVATMSVSREAGGLFESVRFSSQMLEEDGIDVSVVALRDRFTGEDLPRWKPLQPEIVEYVGPRSLLYAPDFSRAIERLQPDIMHTHGLWQPSSIAVLRQKQKAGTPYVVSPRGMLDPWALANSGWKKKLAGSLFENRHLREASCLHALCESEAEAMRAYGLTNPIAVIPNGVTLPEANQRFGESVNQSSGANPKTLLFLGRVHPKKGLPEALRAWAQAAKGRETGWRFVIAGWDQGGHEAELKSICAELGLPCASVPAEQSASGRGQRAETRSQRPEAIDRTPEVSVVFAGPAFGETKEALLRSADAFILPSLSEGLPMSVLEAWAYGLPVLMTDECNLPEGFAAGSAIRIGGAGHADQKTKRPRDQETAEGGKVGVAEGMRQIIEMTDEERGTTGARGRALVEERFTWPKVAAQMVEVYEWVLGRRVRPDFVRLAS